MRSRGLNLVFLVLLPKNINFTFLQTDLNNDISPSLRSRDLSSIIVREILSTFLYFSFSYYILSSWSTFNFFNKTFICNGITLLTLFFIVNKGQGVSRSIGSRQMCFLLPSIEKSKTIYIYIYNV